MKAKARGPPRPSFLATHPRGVTYIPFETIEWFESVLAWGVRLPAKTVLSSDMDCINETAEESKQRIIDQQGEAAEDTLESDDIGFDADAMHESQSEDEGAMD